MMVMTICKSKPHMTIRHREMEEKQVARMNITASHEMQV